MENTVAYLVHFTSTSSIKTSISRGFPWPNVPRHFQADLSRFDVTATELPWLSPLRPSRSMRVPRGLRLVTGFKKGRPFVAGPWVWVSRRVSICWTCPCFEGMMEFMVCMCVCVCASWYNICWPRSVKVVTAWFSVLSRLCCWCSAWVNLADCCIHNQGIDGPKIVHCPQASIKMIDILYYCIPKLRQVSHANHCHIWWTEAFEESLEPVFQAQSLLMTIERKGSRTVHQRWRWDFVQKWGINDDNFDVDDEFRWF